MNRNRLPDHFNAPVPRFGGLDAKLLVVGLAPGLNGANRTGRPFTGDYAGDLLFATLLKFKLARGTYDRRPDDGLSLKGVCIANAVRCVPPENKPLPIEIRTCRPFLVEEIAAMKKLKVILALGKIAHDSVCDVLKVRKAEHPFKHGVAYEIGAQTLISSYHCSRYNTNTGVLTVDMFETVVGEAARLAGL
ncbi:MAG: uracil-DNA glycosylase [Rhizomicrobium sp.]